MSSPKKWEWVTLDKLGTFHRGKQTHYPKNDRTLFEGGTIPFIETQDCKSSRLFIKDVRKFYNQKGLQQGRLFPKNTVCISNNGNVADSAILDSQSCLSCDVHGFNSFSGISDPFFIKYCFDFSKVKNTCISLAKSATTRLSLTTERLKIVEFPYPIYEIQQKIGSILSSRDLLIENNEMQNRGASSHKNGYF
ncbi:restriction endonuclease subunit S [Mycoplasma suis]|uniref:Type I restriction-modification system specificity subunit n=1 Tax=Mycoplasma suis (strain Illinois) TaxID=768700 RepID=F0QS51_MYCSL|nr:restriction endonuclease subunit S [Mycoplasma suis]ADX98321.1 type I restriction-modification system specificity subunit [Mycoplasma suis str. Illinois]